MTRYGPCRGLCSVCGAVAVIIPWLADPFCSKKHGGCGAIVDPAVNPPAIVLLREVDYGWYFDRTPMRFSAA